jgi:hypothetical protein
MCCDISGHLTNVKELTPRLSVHGGAILQRWEDHLRQARHQEGDGLRGGGGNSEATPALQALTAWARISKKAREALKNANPLVVDELEVPILDYLAKVAPLTNW